MKTDQEDEAFNPIDSRDTVGIVAGERLWKRCFGSFAWINCAKVESRLIYFGTKAGKY